MDTQPLSRFFVNSADDDTLGHMILDSKAPYLLQFFALKIFDSCGHEIEFRKVLQCMHSQLLLLETGYIGLTRLQIPYSYEIHIRTETTDFFQDFDVLYKEWEVQGCDHVDQRVARDPESMFIEHSHVIKVLDRLDEMHEYFVKNQEGSLSCKLFAQYGYIRRQLTNMLKAALTKSQVAQK